MLEMRRVLGSVVAMLGAVLVLPASALAERATVVLKDGRAFEGELAEYFPSDHVTLVLANAQRQVISASEVASVRVHAAPATPSAAVEPPAPPVAAAPQEPSVAAAAPISHGELPQVYEPARSPVPGARGKLQLGLSAPLIRYSSVSRSGGGQPNLESSGVQWGLLRAAGVELGYGVSNLIVIGAMVQLNGDSNASDTSESSSFGVILGPKLDLQLDTPTRFKLFLGAFLGLNYGSSENTPKGSTLGVASNSQTTLFRMQARVGVRWFVTDDVSLDLALTGGFETGGSTLTLSNSPSVGVDRTSELDVSGGFVGLNLGTSIWPGLS